MLCQAKMLTLAVQQFSCVKTNNIMKSTLKFTLLIAVATSLSLSSCVTKGKFLLQQDRANRLQRDSTQTHNNLDECNLKVRNLGSDKDQLQSQNEAALRELQNLSSSTKMTIADQAKRLKDLQNLIQAQRDAMNRLKKTIADALVNFKADELSVYVKDGKVYVSLQEKLLFKSGSAVVDPKGREALGSLAKVLNVTDPAPARFQYA